MSCALLFRCYLELCANLTPRCTSVTGESHWRNDGTLLWVLDHQRHRDRLLRRQVSLQGRSPLQGEISSTQEQHEHRQGRERTQRQRNNSGDLDCT